MDSSCGHHTWADIVMVDSPEQLITVGIWEYQRIQGTEKWWLLRPSNLLWRRWGSVIWLLTSHYYSGATTGVNLSLKLCCALNIAAWQVEPDEGCPTCRRNEVELFLALLSILQDLFICTHNFNEIVLWCYEGFNFGSRRKKRFPLAFMCPLASRLSRYNIPSNTNETTMAANASQWFADQRQYSHHNRRQSCEKVYK